MQREVTEEIDLNELIDDEEPTWPYHDLGYDQDDVGESEITVRRLPSGQMKVTIVRAA